MARYSILNDRRQIFASRYTKVPKGRAAQSPQKHPYTLWANTEIGEGQVGCIYSVQSVLRCNCRRARVTTDPI